MYKISYEKCVCFIFLVILAFLSCSGFHIDRIMPLPDHNKKYLFTSFSLNNSSYASDFNNIPYHQSEQMIANGNGQGGYEKQGEDVRDVRGDQGALHLSTALPLQELQRVYERRRQRRIRNTRSRTHHERHHDSRSDRNPSPYQKPTQSEPSRTRRASHRGERNKNPRKNQNRKQGKNRFCPGQDAATRAYRAKTVLEGKIRSKTKIRSPKSNYNVTYEVKEILKDQSRFRMLWKNESIRLQFTNEQVGRSGNCEVKDINGVVPAQFNISKNYVLFANRIGDHEYKILGPPVESTRKTLQEIKNILGGKTKVRPAKILTPARVVRAVAGQRVRLVCKTEGQPPPVVRWHKDGRELPTHHRHKKMRIDYKRKRSVLTLFSATEMDSGRYECVARGVIGPPANVTRELLVSSPPPPPPSYQPTHGRPQHPHHHRPTSEHSPPEGSSPCTAEYDREWCMNGGTCLYFRTLNEFSCQCAEGFNGRRCENKEVTNKSNEFENGQ